MLTDTFYDTPVRRDEYSITKTNVLCRPKNKVRPAVKVNRPCLEDNSEEKVLFKPTTEELSEDAGFDSKTDSDVSVIEVDEMDATSTSCRSLLCYKADSEDEVMISAKKLSTPDYIEAQTKAVSSTPNQDTSRLIRNVASQTNLTQNAREFKEYSNDIKTFIVEILEENSDSLKCKSQVSHCNMNSSSPSRSYDHKKTNVRKLSLRSKTMISSAFERSKDMFPRHKSLEEKRLISNTFSLLPNPKTPPSCSFKAIHNPFEIDLSERLGKSIVSPDVFENVLSPSEDSVRWTIEDISSINPVAIEEDFTLPSDDEDPEKESQVQQEIERYFSETHSVLSPADLSQLGSISQNKKVKSHKRAAASTPQKIAVVITKEFSNACTQTMLSLPVVVSDKLEYSLNTFFKIFELDEFNTSASNLRRKLFFHSEDEPPSPVRFEIRSSPNTKGLAWDSENSSYTCIRKERHFTPLGNQGAFSSPEMSPVVPEFASYKCNNNFNLLSTCKKTLELHYSSGNQLLGVEVNDDATGNSTVTMHSIDGLEELIMDSESMSVVPSSQDTGYHTEESCNLMASTPTRRSD